MWSPLPDVLVWTLLACAVRIRRLVTGVTDSLKLMIQCDVPRVRKSDVSGNELALSAFCHKSRILYPKFVCFKVSSFFPSL